jgi:hypothetical protein
MSTRHTFAEPLVETPVNFFTLKGGAMNRYEVTSEWEPLEYEIGGIKLATFRAAKIIDVSLRINQQRKDETVRSCGTCSGWNCNTSDTFKLTNGDCWKPRTASPVA